MEVVVVIVDNLVTIQLDVRGRITGDDTDLASSPNVAQVSLVGKGVVTEACSYATILDRAE